jgi:glyoxylase-like metal-dependent hydrolase (beta-lactamase superfamily II)
MQIEQKLYTKFIYMKEIIFPLSEGVFTIGRDKIFVPFDETKDILEERSTGSLLVEIQPFLIKLNNDIILLDTGLGFENNGILQLHENIKKCNINPEDVTKVILSHLHKDHAGGISYTNALGEKVLSFPNAIYYVHEDEFNAAMQNTTASYIIDEIEMLQFNDKVEWLTGYIGSVDEYIFFEKSSGHCPHHICITIITPEGIIFYGGDEAPQLKQLKVRYKTKYDFNPERSLELRDKYTLEGKLKHWTFLFYHDVKTPYSML